MKKQILITLTMLIFGGIGGYLFSTTTEEEKYITEDKNQPRPSHITQNRIPASVKLPSSQVAPSVEGILNKLKQNTIIAQMHQKVLTKFPDLDEKQLLADWVIMGAMPGSSEEYGQMMFNIIDGLNERPEEILEAITSNYGEFGPEDSFIKTMLINTVHQLNVPDQDKIQFYGDRFSDKITLNQNDKFDIDAMNITNAMAFANQYKKSIEDIKPFVLDGLLKSQENKKVQKLLAQRFKTYFSEMGDEIDSIVGQ